MFHHELKIGMKVLYSPSPGHWFAGTVATAPWQLGDIWVTKLNDMEPGYAEFTGKRGDKATTVYAASLESMVLPFVPDLN